MEFKIRHHTVWIQQGIVINWFIPAAAHPQGSRTFCFAKLRSLPQANVRYFFVRFDLMNWRDSGIMVR